MTITRICKWCGKEFETSSSRRLYCYDQHYAKCTVCGKEFEISLAQIASNKHTCSETCSNAAKAPYYDCVCTICGRPFKSKNSHAKYCEQTHQKRCEVCGELFDCSTVNQWKYRKTCSESCRYALAHQSFQLSCGKDNIEGYQQFLDNYRTTMLERYGVDNPRKVSEFVEKAKKTSLQRYGTEYPTQSALIKQKQVATFRKNYGYDWALQSPQIQNKAKLTCLKKYGVDNFAKSATHVATKMIDPSKSDNCAKFRSDPEAFIYANFASKPTLGQLSQICGIRESSVGDIVHRMNIESLVNYTISSMEQEVLTFLLKHLPESEILHNTRKIIEPLELDFYVPKYRLAIECNPTYTHNSSVGGWGDAPKPRNYHQQKTELCEMQGILLFHIFGYDWSNKRAVIESMLATLLNQAQARIFARNTNIALVEPKVAYEFLSENHRQSPIYSKVNLGLFYNNELESLMCFSRMRKTIGTGHENLDDCWELTRFCSKLNHIVVGGASKLFKHFVTNYKPNRIRSFSDRAHTRGTLYAKLGFQEIRRSDPGYVWVDTDETAWARNNAQKQNIKKFLKDDSIDLSKTEFEIMEEHNYFAVFDSGTITWEWNSLE